MSKRALFWRFFGTHILILVAAVGFAALYTWDMSSISFKNQWIHELKMQARLAAALLPVGNGVLDKEEISSFFERVRKADDECRFTLILPDGKVLGDTDADLSRMTSHHDRPEVVEALKNGQGQSQRYSASLGEQMLYLALRVPSEGPVQAVIRVSVSEQKMLRDNGTAAHVMIVLLLLVLGATLSISFAATRRIIGNVSDLQNGLVRIGRGELDYRLEIPPVPHLADLARTINQTVDQMQNNMLASNKESNLRR